MNEIMTMKEERMKVYNGQKNYDLVSLSLGEGRKGEASKNRVDWSFIIHQLHEDF